MKYFRWSSVRGMNLRDAPQSLPDDIAFNVSNIELMAGALGRRRSTSTAIDLTSGPTARIRYLVEHTYNDVAEKWAFSGTTNIGAHRNNGAWSSVTLTDTPSGLGIHAATFNNKLFVAYNSSENRLHVIEDGTCRRVGLGKPAALTVANTGAGAYAATARRYRTAQRIKSGTTVLATSELSDAVEFTPSGAGTAARITKSATEDSATHWVVYGLISTSGDTYDLYEELAEVAVGTTTYDDSTAPASYNGNAPMQLGLNIPPPSCRMLLATANRILMAGVYETSGASDETAPLDDRVYFTRVLGSSDKGDDESIPNTTTQKNWIDVGRNDGDTITALAGPIDGVIYVFKKKSIWRLVPTNIDTQPFVAEVVTKHVGAQNSDSSHSGLFSQYCTVTAEDDFGQPVIYFVSLAGAYRLSAAGGVEYVGWDITDPTTGSAWSASSVCCGAFVSRKRHIWWLDATTSRAWVFTPAFSRRTEQGWRGGWAQYTFDHIFTNVDAIINTETASTGVAPIVGGHLTTNAKLYEFTSHGYLENGESFNANVISKPYLLGVSGAHKVRLGNPILEGKTDSGIGVTSVTYDIDHTRETRTGTASLATATSQSRMAVPVENLEGADAQAVAIQVTWASDQRYPIDAVTVPYEVQEPIA